MFSQRSVAFHAATVLALGLFGCGPGGPRTYPVKGAVELVEGDVKQLAGNHVEAALTTDPSVRASGEIQPDGSFRLETIHAGTILKGAREGQYQVRIILADDDPASLRRRYATLATRFLRFQTSGLSLQVPATGDLTLKVSRY